MSGLGETEIKVGDRVEWESQSQGSWKRKAGIVAGVRDTILEVDVDAIVSFDPHLSTEVGERKKLRKPKRYLPRKKICRKI